MNPAHPASLHTVCQGLDRNSLWAAPIPWGTCYPIGIALLHLVCHPLIQPPCPRCPHDETVTYLNAIGESTTAKFSFQMFQFVGYPEVFLHCRVQLCVPDNPEPCAKVSSLAGLHLPWVAVGPGCGSWR